MMVDHYVNMTGWWETDYMACRLHNYQKRYKINIYN